jgi:hypothetical protein
LAGGIAFRSEPQLLASLRPYRLAAVPELTLDIEKLADTVVRDWPTAMTSTSSAIDFTQHCPSCGGVFTVDRFEATSPGARLHIIVKNSGEYGNLNLVLDACRVFVLGSRQAEDWVKSYRWARAKGRNALELYEKVTSSYGLRAANEDELPRELGAGESWSGWFESSRPLADEIAAMIVIIGPFRRDGPHGFANHMTLDDTRPFISLRGEVLVEPPSSVMRWAGWLVAWLRCLWRLENLGMVLGALAGAVADNLGGTVLLFTFAGLVGGWHLFHVLAKRLQERAKS